MRTRNIHRKINWNQSDALKIGEHVAPDFKNHQRFISVFPVLRSSCSPLWSLFISYHIKPLKLQRTTKAYLCHGSSVLAASNIERNTNLPSNHNKQLRSHKPLPRQNLGACRHGGKSNIQYTDPSVNSIINNHGFHERYQPVNKSQKNFSTEPLGARIHSRHPHKQHIELSLISITLLINF